MYDYLPCLFLFVYDYLPCFWEALRPLYVRLPCCKGIRNVHCYRYFYYRSEVLSAEAAGEEVVEVEVIQVSGTMVALLQMKNSVT